MIKQVEQFGKVVTNVCISIQEDGPIVGRLAHTDNLIPMCLDPARFNGNRGVEQLPTIRLIGEHGYGDGWHEPPNTGCRNTSFAEMALTEGDVNDPGG